MAILAPLLPRPQPIVGMIPLESLAPPPAPIGPHGWTTGAGYVSAADWPARSQKEN